MADVYNPAGAKVTCVGTLMGQLYNMQLYVQRASVDPGEWDEDALSEVASKAAAFLELGLLPLLTSQLQFYEVRAREMAAGQARQVVQGVALQGGQGTGDPMPGSVALCVRGSTGFAGRGFSTRTYVGGLTENMVDGNQVAAGTVSNILSAFNTDWINRLINTGNVQMEPVVYKRRAFGVPLSTAVLVPVTQYVVTDTVVDQQRRRLPGRGR